MLLFGVGDISCGRHENLFFGTNGVISWMLTIWASVIRDLLYLVDKLHAELSKMRDEMESKRKTSLSGSKGVRRSSVEREKLAAEEKARQC